MIRDLRKVESHFEVLARLMVCAYGAASSNEPGNSAFPNCDALGYFSTLRPNELTEFLNLANSHHVVMRTLSVLDSCAVAQGAIHAVEWCRTTLQVERDRIQRAVAALHSICAALEENGCSVAVIKSLDHWPDLGSDLDLYTTADARCVEQVMQGKFGATVMARSWGDRLAHKWNFRVSGMPELVEVHVKFLGQVGEHDEIARRVIARRVVKEVDGYQFYIPAVEERIIISALQRMYRHFYFRLCDMIDMAALLATDSCNFVELRRAAQTGGIWPGVATFLSLTRQFVLSYGGAMALPLDVTKAAIPGSGVRFGDGFLRLPRLPAARLYSSQLLHAGRNRDIRSLFRLPLLPPLALSALLAYRLTGNDKGIW